MTPIYIAITLLAVVAIFLMDNRGRGILFAFGASLLALAIFGAAYVALAAIIIRSM